MTTDTPPAGGTITTAGRFDLTVEEYIKDPVRGGSLSRSGAKKLLPPSTPARFRYDLDHPEETTTPQLTLGKAAHRFVLGIGPDIEVCHFDNWRTKDAREQKAEAILDGRVPMLIGKYEEMADMVVALRQHREAARLLDPGNGTPEQALIWQDERTGIWRRAMLDLLPFVDDDGRMVIPDYKTCAAADDESISRSIDRYRYHMQGPWYIDAVLTLGLAEDAEFRLVFQEVDSPYLVHVVELDPPAFDVGRYLNRQAIDIYQECTSTGVWPGYNDDGVSMVSLPPWTENRYRDELAADELVRGTR
jgi:hypothetical protein